MVNIKEIVYSHHVLWIYTDDNGKVLCKKTFSRIRECPCIYKNYKRCDDYDKKIDEELKNFKEKMNS
jgi:hypothetical protein